MEIRTSERWEFSHPQIDIDIDIDRLRAIIAAGDQAEGALQADGLRLLAVAGGADISATGGRLGELYAERDRLTAQLGRQVGARAHDVATTTRAALVRNRSDIAAEVSRRQEARKPLAAARRLRDRAARYAIEHGFNLPELDRFRERGQIA